jgi:hypothetical protein
MSIIEILGGAAFFALLTAFGFMRFSNEFLSLGKKLSNKKGGAWLWFYVIMWVALLLWGMYEVLFV